MFANKVFEAMQRLVDSPELDYFQSYRDDFFVHDRREIIEWGSPTARYLWTVRASGTDLTRLGVHPACHNWAEAVFDMLDRERTPAKHFVIVSADASGVASVREISRSKARSELAKPCAYEVDGLQVKRHGQTVALCFVKSEVRFNEMTKLHVAFDTQKQGEIDLGALRLLAQHVVCKAAGSLLVGPASITIDGVDIMQAKEAMQARYSEVAA
jgi:hypothetical protein